MFLIEVLKVLELEMIFVINTELHSENDLLGRYMIKTKISSGCKYETDNVIMYYNKT